MEQGITAPDPGRDPEGEPGAGRIPFRRDRMPLERHPRLAPEIACERTPDDGDVDVTIGHGLDQPRRWIGIRVIPVDAVPGDVPDDAPPGQGFGRRGVLVIVTDEMDADP